MRSHGFGERVGVGTDINKILMRAAGWGSALVKPTYCFGIVMLTREALFDELAKEPNRSGSTERHPSTKFFGLWKSFSKNFLPARFQPRRIFPVK